MRASPWWGVNCPSPARAAAAQVLTVVVDGHNTFTGARTHGCLHLVDLAGSERNNKSEATGAALCCFVPVTSSSCFCFTKYKTYMHTRHTHTTHTHTPQATGWWRPTTSTAPCLRWAT